MKNCPYPLTNFFSHLPVFFFLVKISMATLKYAISRMKFSISCPSIAWGRQIQKMNFDIVRFEELSAIAHPTILNQSVTILLMMLSRM